MSQALKSVDELGPQGRAKRAQILAAARRLFMQHGFERTSMDAIRETAEVSKPTLYNHYPSKEGLFADVLGDVVDELAGDWIPAAAGAFVPQSREELEQQLTMIAHQATTGLMRSQYIALVRVVITEAPQFPQLGEIFRAAGPERGLKMLTRILENASAQGSVTIVDTDVAARMFIGTILTYVMIDGLISGGESRLPAPEKIDTMVAMFMKTIS